jgi:hemerythrin-like domain-containing protein
MAKVFYPDKDIQMPEIKTTATKPDVKEISYSPPLKILVDEHKLIKRWIAMIPEIIQKIDIKLKSHQEMIEFGIDFIKSFADKFHHAKEEEILFKYFDENLDIIKTMYQDHETARAHVRAIVDALVKKDETTMAEHLISYKELLTEHIKKENEILYPWMDRNLSMTQVGELYSKFQAAEAVLSAQQKEKYKQFVEQLEANGIKTLSKVVNL